MNFTINGNVTTSAQAPAANFAGRCVSGDSPRKDRAAGTLTLTANNAFDGQVTIGDPTTNAMRAPALYWAAPALGGA